MSILALCALAAIPFLAAPAVGASFRVAAPRCEYLAEPLGIDVLAPRLSWKLEGDEPGLRQSAYRILVADSKSLLQKSEANLWDSGEVRSDRSTLIPYSGKPLQAEQECWWKVRVRNQDGRFSPWSAPARWTMGLLHPTDWKAKWIGSGEPVPQTLVLSDPWLRKTFTLEAAPQRAVIHVASIGYHELWVNGRKVGDSVLAPAVSNLRKRARYVTYEIAPYLKKGDNVIGLWLGAGWSLYPEYSVEGRPRRPMVLAQATFFDGKDPTRTIGTDETWQVRSSPNKLVDDFGNHSFGGEEFDARMDDPTWCAPGDTTQDWVPPTIYHPGVQVTAEILEPNRIEHVLAPTEITKNGSGYRIDMGRNFAGWIEIPITGSPGTRVEFECSERPDQEMTHNLHSYYVIGPTGHGVFCNRFNYSSARWVTIKGLHAKPPIDQIKGYQIRSGYRRASTFRCSNQLLNNIYETTLWTFENLSLGGYVVDCPQRERRGYGGDAHSTTQTALDNYSMGAFYTKWSQDWRDVQASDGSVPYTAPTYSGGGGVPWSGYCIHLPWKLYEHYGDTRILRENFPTMRRWLASLEPHMRDGLLQRWGGDWDFLGDWLWPYDDTSGIPNGDKPETLFFANCYLAYALETASKVASAIGEEIAAKIYSAKAANLCNAIHARFYHPETHDYANGHQQYLAIALLAGVPPKSEEPKIWKRLEEEILVHRKGHIDAGIVGGALLTRLLIEGNRSDLMYVMATKDDYPSWGHFLETGLTTMPEAWDEVYSWLHSSFIFVDAWFIEGVAGIRPGPQGGFKHFVLRPMLNEKPPLNHVSASYDSDYGVIKISWTRNGSKVNLMATVPPNSTATLYLPGRGPKELLPGTFKAEI